MLTRLYLIRHGESAGNAGLPTANHKTIPLTQKGRLQADMLAKKWQVEPDYIFVSPFWRAKETAQPTLERFPDAIRQVTSDLQEFTYLSPATCVNTTKKERCPRVDAYWERCEPYYIDGEGAESFAQLVERAQRFLQGMVKFSGISNHMVFAFSHMLFMICFRSLVEKPDLTLEERMRQFRKYPAIKNAAYLSFDIWW